MENLRIGDVVRLLPLTPDPFQDLTVINKTDKEITFFRTYVSLRDYISPHSGAPALIGIEQFSAPIRSLEYQLLTNIYHGA